MDNLWRPNLLLLKNNSSKDLPMPPCSATKRHDQHTADFNYTYPADNDERQIIFNYSL